MRQMAKPMLGLFVMGLVLAMVYWSHADTVITRSGGAPTNAAYIVQTPHAALTGEQALSALATGCLTSTTTTGVVATRNLSGTTNQITITNPDCSANPIFSLSTTLVIPGPGIEFSETAGDATCASGNYWIKANSTTGNFRKCQNGTVSDLDASGSGTIGGTVGTVDEAIPVANGVGGSTLKASTCTITSGMIACPGGFKTTGGGVGLWTALEGTSPGAGANAGEHNIYVDSTTHRLASYQNGGSAKDYLTAADTQTLTNKSLDCEGTGNVCTMPMANNMPMAGCDNVTATTSWDLPTANAMGKACLGTGARYGILTAADGATSRAFKHFRWPTDLTGAVDVAVEYTGDTSSVNNIRTQVSIACVGPGEDLLSPTFNTASAINNSGPATAGQEKVAVLTGVNVANCAAGEHAILQLESVRGDAGDTYTGVAHYLNVYVVHRRAI